MELELQNWGKIEENRHFEVEPRGIENSPKGLFDSSNPDKTCWRNERNHGEIYRKYKIIQDDWNFIKLCHLWLK